MITLEKISQQKCGVIANLLQFYMFELNQVSTFKHFELNDNGQYKPYPYFENYWLEENRFPYLIQQDKAPIGFSLVHDITINPNLQWKLAEFFILPEYRQQHFGLQAAIQTIRLHSGSWEVSVLSDNKVAKQFWLAVFQALNINYRAYAYHEFEVFEMTHKESH